MPPSSSITGHGASDSKWEPIVWPDWETFIPPRELWVGPNDPAVHFFRWIWEYRAYLVMLCGMAEDSCVLELGCNHGRTMLGLLDYLQPPGRYNGLDIMPKQIDYAQTHIQTPFPHFTFGRADIYNAVYNPQGKGRPETFVFPFPENHFDIAYAASLFTHLLPSAVMNYFQQSRRVLRDGGYCLFSFFLLDYYRGPGTSAWKGYEFNHPLENSPGVAVYDPQIPEQIVAYDSTLVEKIAIAAGLKVQRILPGYWSKTHKVSLNEQDLVLLQAV